MVLLKNEDSILPIERKKIKRLAIIGSMAFDPRYQGSGSSKINPHHIDSPYEHIKILAGDDISVLPHQGYIHDEVVEQAHLEDQAVELAKNAQLVLLFVGLPDHDESEGYDRTHINLPDKQIALIKKICKVQPETVVIVQNGGVIDMSWEHAPKAIVEMFLGGQAGGDAIAKLLFGENNFCGKLAETIPMKLEDTPSYINFPGIQDEVIFGESIFVGYRYYDYTKKKVRFPFGFGLSYTTFAYEKLEQPALVLNSDGAVTVKCRVANTGKLNGKEIVQLYTGKDNSKIKRPLRELRGFKKVTVPAGKSVEVSFVLGLDDFSFYNPTTKRWEHESGIHEIYIGASSRDLAIVYPIEITEKLIRPITRFAYISDFERTERGQKVLKILLDGFKEIMGEGQDTDDAFLIAMLKNTPLRKIVEYSRGIFTAETIDKVVTLVNSDEPLDDLTFETLVDSKEKKKGFFENLFGGRDKNVSIHSKIKDLVENDQAMFVLRNYFDDETFASEYLQLAIKMGVTLDKAQKLLPEDFFSEKMLKEIDKELRSLAK